MFVAFLHLVIQPSDTRGLLDLFVREKEEFELAVSHLRHGNIFALLRC